jgi:hypothetical protein
MRLAMVAGEASGDLLAGLLLGGLQAPLARPAHHGHRRAEDGGAGLRGLVAQRQAGGARLCRGAASLPRDLPASAITGRAPAARAAASLHRRRCPDFNLGLEHRLRAAGVKTGALHLPVDLGLARRSRQEAGGAAATMCLCLFPFEPELLHAHGVAATYVGHPLADAIPLQAPREAARAALGVDAGESRAGGRAARQPSLEIQYNAATFLQAAALMHQRRSPDAAVRAAAGAGAARHGRAAAGRSMRRACRCCCATAIAHRAGGLRRDADRQRHRHAGGGAVPPPDGHRLPRARAELPADEAHGLPALGRPAQHPVPRLRRARTAAARLHAAALADAALAWLDDPVQVPLSWRAASRTCTTCCAATRRKPPPMPSRKSSRPEQLGLRLGRPGPGGRRRRGGSRPAGRAGGGSGGDPGRRAR